MNNSYPACRRANSGKAAKSRRDVPRKRVGFVAMSYTTIRIYLQVPRTPNEPVEKVPTAEKLPKLGVAKPSSTRDHRFKAKYGGYFFENFFTDLFLQAQR
jgi:hypothetical protein